MFFAKHPAKAASRKKASTLPEKQSPTAPPPVPMSNISNLATPRDSRMLTGGLTNPLERDLAGRSPIVIKSALKRAEPLTRPSRQARRKHSKRLWLLGMLVLITTLTVTLLGLTPQGQGLAAKFSKAPSKDDSSQITLQNNKALAPAALATTTYMYQNDGFDPYSHGQVNVSDGKNSLPWPYGQCTYWANYRYHQLTGYWVQWTGNADQWFLGAQKANWDYGQKPPPGIPSIVVLMPYVQGAGGVGHVAVVESISGNVIHTSNMNWGYGGWTHVEDVDFILGAGVYFAWHKPANS